MVAIFSVCVLVSFGDLFFFSFVGWLVLVWEFLLNKYINKIKTNVYWWLSKKAKKQINKLIFLQPKKRIKKNSQKFFPKGKFNLFLYKFSNLTPTHSLLIHTNIVSLLIFFLVISF